MRTTFDSTKLALRELLMDLGEGKIQLPDFKRGWIWDDDHIKSLLASVSMTFPVGAVMTLETGGKGIRFKPRPIEGTEIEDVEPDILILDGQQRLTSLFQALVCDKPVRTREAARAKALQRYYYIDMKKALSPNEEREDAVVSVSQERKLLGFRGEELMDLSNAEREYANCMFPTNQMFDSAAWRRAFNKHRREDSDKAELFDHFEEKLIDGFKSYQLPVIELGKKTPKEAVCLVFEKVNTGGVPLNVFELLTATFAADDFQLREDWDSRRKRMVAKHEVLEAVESDNFLQAVSLMVTYSRRENHFADGGSQEDAPAVGCRRRDVLQLTVQDYKEWADSITGGFEKAARFLYLQKIFKPRDVPYPTQLVPLAATYAALGRDGETDSTRRKIARWYWCGVLGELYGSSTETRFARDLPEVVTMVRTGGTLITVTEANFSASRLLSLRTRNSTAYKGIYALLMRDGCLDLATGEPIEAQTYFDDQIDIHHVFPRKWCERHQIEPRFYQSIINKTAIAARTNRSIGGRAPSSYLLTIEKNIQVSTGRLDEILDTHRIAAGKLRLDDYWGFYWERGEAILGLIQAAMEKPVVKEEGVFSPGAEADDFEDTGEDEQFQPAAG